jgi:hypothetical protein
MPVLSMMIDNILIDKVEVTVANCKLPVFIEGLRHLLEETNASVLIFLYPVEPDFAHGPLPLVLRSCRFLVS